MNTGGTDQAADAPIAAPDTAARLLSPLRVQRFDLLLHLIANLEQPLAVCGPEGSGKTTFLRLLGEQASENWRVIPLDTATRPTAEQAQDAILAALDGGGPDSRREPETLFAQLARGGQLAVVVLDDAGRLPPLTLSELHRLARRFPVLRLVLALRPEEARARASTNAGLFDDCHVIAVPPLDENGSEGFLRQLAPTSPSPLAQGDITPEFIARVFRDSGGIPGRIPQVLSAPVEEQRAVVFGGRFVWLGAVGISFAVTLLVAWLWLGVEVQQEPPVVGEAAPTPVPAIQPSAPAEPVSGVPEPLSEGKPAEPVPLSSGGVPIPAPISAGEASSDTAQKTVETPQDKPAGEPVATAEPPAEHAVKPVSDQSSAEEKKEGRLNPPGADLLKGVGQGQPGGQISLPARVSGPEWILAQDPTAWSLQIMSARNPASVTALRQRHPELKGLITYRVTHRGRALYLVLYGVFRSGKEARHAAARLPESLGDAVPRRFGEIQRHVAASLKPK